MSSSMMNTTALVSGLSVYQQAILNWAINGTGNAIIMAVAGSGKTFTLIKLLSVIKGNVLMMAFNTPIADEINEKIKQAGIERPGLKASTVHSAGLSIYRQAFPKVKTDLDKVHRIMDELGIKKEWRTFVRRVVGMAKQRAIGVLTPFKDTTAWYDMVSHFDMDLDLPETDPDRPDEELPKEEILRLGLRYAYMTLIKSVKMENVIDFDDMIYMPLVKNVRGGVYDWLLIDEAQDTNPARRALAVKLLKPRGRLVAVGDEKQSIYGFTGADHDAMELIRQTFKCIVLPLSVTYRCPKAVVRLCQLWVPHLEAAENAPEGQVIDMEVDKFWKDFAPTLKPTDAILCRNTRPLVENAYHLIRMGIACKVIGREIGRGLLKMLSRWKIEKVSDYIIKLDSWADKEIHDLMEQGKEQAAEILNDRVETVKVILDRVKELHDDPLVEDARNEVKTMFADEFLPKGQKIAKDKEKPILTLSTGHRFKGDERTRIIWWGPNKFNPSPFARQDWQVIQEDNLMYVMATRVKWVANDNESGILVRVMVA